MWACPHQTMRLNILLVMLVIYIFLRLNDSTRSFVCLISSLLNISYLFVMLLKGILSLKCT